jgi:hypothetical protein
MVDTIIKIITPAPTYDILDLEELKDMLGILDTDTSQDEQLQMYITQYSDVISRICNRVFAREEVRETVRCLQPSRYYVSHWPLLEGDIESIESPRGSEIDSSLFEVEEDSGKIVFTAARSEPIVVTYKGGYLLPDEAPPALKAACELLIREARNYAARQAVSGIRSIAHKESRVQYFDVNAALGKSIQTPFTVANQTVQSLLYHFMRLWV